MKGSVLFAQFKIMFLKVKVVFCALLIWVFNPSRVEDGTNHLRECEFSAPENYSKLIPPNEVNEKGEIVPIEVSFTLKIERFTEINDEKRFMDFQFISTVFWRDHHLAKVGKAILVEDMFVEGNNSSDFPASNNCSGRVDQTEYFSKFWYPALEYPSLTEARLGAYEQ